VYVMQASRLIVVGIALLCLGLLMSAPLTIAQVNPTEQQETVDAAVQSLFEQTAQADMTAAVQAAFEAALTGTASGQEIEKTPSPTFTLTPTPFSIAGLALDEQVETELVGGAGRTSAYLAPDGTRFAHIENFTICIYTIELEQQGCVGYEETTLRVLYVETVVWSPDGRYLAMHEDFLRTFNDSDIWVMDTENYTLTNITDDGVGRVRVEDLDDPAGPIDLAPQWLNDQIVFIRYNGTGIRLSTPQLVSIRPDGSELEPLGDLRSSKIRFSVYMFDISPNSKRITYHDFAQDDMRNAVWISDLNGENAEQLVSGLAIDRFPLSLAFSSDGRYILANTPPPLGTGMRDRNAVYVIEVETGTVIEFDEPTVHFAGWSPEGSALVYQVFDPLQHERTGIYLTDKPGTPGRKIFEGRYYSPTNQATRPIPWAVNNVLLLTNVEDSFLDIIQLGQD
jgi:hypothetical protein